LAILHNSWVLLQTMKIWMMCREVFYIEISINYVVSIYWWAMNFQFPLYLFWTMECYRHSSADGLQSGCLYNIKFSRSLHSRLTLVTLEDILDLWISILVHLRVPGIFSFEKKTLCTEVEKNTTRNWKISILVVAAFLFNSSGAT
jgi:hypothetical protein